MVIVVVIMLLLVIGFFAQLFESTPISTPQPVDPAARAAFLSAVEQWLTTVMASLPPGRWIPKSAATRLLTRFPAPEWSGQSWKQAVGDASPQGTLTKHFDRMNRAHLTAQMVARKAFFETVEKNPLTDEQIHACVCMDDAVMVVAAAGSGKTSTMVAKTGYALHEGLATPEQILLLAFNRATADEVGTRITEQLRQVPDVDRVRSNTFHAFGIEVIAKATGKKPSLASWVSPDNPGADVRKISDIIQSLSKRDASFKHDWDLFRTIYARDVGKWGQHQAPEAYRDGRVGFLTVQGEVVKSKEERTLADWLFYHGVRYFYEQAYEHDTADANHRQYFPDFYYPDAKLYHEHFALNARGEAPKAFKNYLEGVVWKRRLHAEKGTALFETTSHGLMTGDALKDLEAVLIQHGVKTVFNPDRTRPHRSPQHEETDLSRSFRVFQQHVKNNSLTHAQLQTALTEQSKDGFGARLRLYLSLYERIAAEWEQCLRAAHAIDFEDMLVQAADHVEFGTYKSPYTLILADEFQDSSRARIRLLRALAANPGVQTHLCVVGDDWQGINRFAGSDISVMTEFEKTFDFATRLTLNTTFRCPQHLCDVSSQFIQANPAQIRKTVKTTNPLSKTPMLAYSFNNEETIPDFIEQQLTDMHRYVREGKLIPAKGTRVSILLLGRYRRDEPRALEQWQARFGDQLSIAFKTVHGSKGLESEYVFVLKVTQGTHGFPSQIQDDPALQLAMPAPDDYPFSEERRLFYVAVTRARKQVRLYTTLSQPSQFLVELVKAHHLVIEPVDGEALEPCPKCGNGILQLRHGKYGDFLGCSLFPGCDYRRKLDPDQAQPLASPRSQRIRMPVNEGDPCPVCKQGTLRLQTGRNGLFLGCSRWRAGCRATANLR